MGRQKDEIPVSDGKTYWQGGGKFQDFAADLQDLIPIDGDIDDSVAPALEHLRKAINCYHDLYNNGLCNRAPEFSIAFGFDGTRLIKKHRPTFSRKLEAKMDEIVMAAAEEQKLPRLIAQKESEILIRKNAAGQLPRAERKHSTL